MSTLYPVCVSYAHDNMPSDKVVAVSGQLILISGIGSIAGPLIGEWLMHRFGINALFILMTLAAIVLATTTVIAESLIKSPLRLASPFMFLTPQSGPLSHDVMAHGPLDEKDTPQEFNGPTP